MVFYITSNTIGRGDDELGEILMPAYLNALSEAENLPAVIILVNSGVKLMCEGSPVIAHLETLVGLGIDVIGCGTCLDFYRLKEKIAVGSITNAKVIMDHLTGADKVVTL